MSDDPVNEVELANQLTKIGCAVGRSKSGRILRIDNRDSLDTKGAAANVKLLLELLPRVLDCSALKELYVRGVTGFLNQHCVEIAGLGKLKVLDVEDSDLSDDSLQVLSKSQSLQVLNVRGTNVTQECVVALRKVMLGVRIIL